jgi:hypothetical protein
MVSLGRFECHKDRFGCTGRPIKATGGETAFEGRVTDTEDMERIQIKVYPEGETQK